MRFLHFDNRFAGLITTEANCIGHDIVDRLTDLPRRYNPKPEIFQT